MNVDANQLSSPRNASHDSQPDGNALAGPSTIAEPPLLFLPPTGPTQTLPRLTSTQDLLTRFQLLPAYDKYVRPHYATPSITGQDHPPTPGASAKGKERERDMVTSPVAAHTPGDVPDGDDDDGGGKGEKKKKNSYKHLIKGIPGKHSMKKDDYLFTMMQVPPKQRMAITPFDLRTQREAFSVSLEGLKGWNVNALVLESAQAREDRKRRKELKKLAKAQALGISPSDTTSPAVTSTPAPASAIVPGRTSTPRPRPPSVQMPGATGTARGGTPASSPHFIPTPIVASAPAQLPTPSIQPPPSIASDPAKRGKKRELEDAAQMSGGQGATVPNGNGSASGVKPKPVLGARAGVAGVRPRPLKKQRMDVQGQARDMPVQQQPTPQGV